MSRILYSSIVSFLFLIPSFGFAFVIDGDGHYGLQPGTQTNPGFSESRGLYQATRESFSLLANARATDALNFKFNLRIFENPRDAFMGDTPEPEYCSKLLNDKEQQRDVNDNRGSAADCEGRYQNTREPHYKAYKPRFTEAYIEYGNQFCLLQAGRKARSWGMGIFLDDGRKPFSDSASIYDGASCSLNALKSETLGFSVGFDRLAETGASIDVGIPRDQNEHFGPNKNSDDYDQIYLSMVLDDTKAQDKNSLARKIGIYVANVFGTAKVGVGDDKTKAKSDVKFADLYTAFYWRGFSLRNELLFRLGKSSDPNWSREGGISTDSSTEPVKNNVDAIAFAGDIGIRFGEQGSVVGPEEYHQGTASSHLIFGEYAHAPGDRDGYALESERLERNAKRVTAVSFHQNYKPALIFFNGRYGLDDMRVDGVFDPNRVTNATVFTLGYKYESLKYGDFSFKLISAEMNVTMPESDRAPIRNAENELRAKNEKNGTSERTASRPVGYSGKHLGYELDLGYQKFIGKSVLLGVQGAVAIPGPAWRIYPDEAPAMSYLLLGNATFNF